MHSSSCPICKRAVLPRLENAAFPFCTERCKQIDLGLWFSETYRVPTKEEAVDAGDLDVKENDEDVS